MNYTTFSIMSKRQYFLKERKDDLFSKLKGQKFPSTNNINTSKNMYTLKTHELLVRTSILEIIYITSDLFIWLQTSDRPGTVRVHLCVNSSTRVQLISFLWPFLFQSMISRVFQTNNNLIKL